MRFFATALLLLFSLSATAADYAREKNWADEVVPGIVVGDPVYLELAQGHKFLTLFTEEKEAKAALVIVHGMGIHPDWGMVGTLRTQLADQGYTTLSVQMPVFAVDARAEQYLAAFPEAAERIGVAVDFLRAKGYKKIALVSHSMGSRMSRLYVMKHQNNLVAWASLGIGGGDTYAGIRIPVLDLYGENDLPPVLEHVKERAASLKGNVGAKQLRVPKADHFYNNHETEMVQAVRRFLDQTIPVSRPTSSAP
jgi:pimeloyl-ACP methyl ester carboxylesterase